MTDSKPAVNSSLARTPLFDIISQQGARMTAFSGWEMPVQFTGITSEHQAVRQQVGLFDISHMGKFILRGSQLRDQLQRLVPSDLSRLSPGQAQYTVLLNDRGGILDDLIIYDQGTIDGEYQVTIIVNAATREQDKAWFLEHFNAHPVDFQDLSLSHVLLAIQGPKALSALQPLVQDDLSAIAAFGHLQTNLLDQPAFIARTGYTGEDGFEIMVEPAMGKALWRSLTEAGVIPCGLGARDTLRLEAAMGLYGQDMDETTTPLEVGLSWLVHLDSKNDFLGRSILETQRQKGLSRRLVGLQMQGRNIARHDYPILHEDQVIGKVTSGTLSPTLGYPIALAYVPPALAKLGQSVAVEIRGKSYGAKVVKRPFYRRSA